MIVLQKLESEQYLNYLFKLKANQNLLLKIFGNYQVLKLALIELAELALSQDFDIFIYHRNPAEFSPELKTWHFFELSLTEIQSNKVIYDHRKMICIACHETPSEIIYPCGHSMFCQSCEQKYDGRLCPVCRTDLGKNK